MEPNQSDKGKEPVWNPFSTAQGIDVSAEDVGRIEALYGQGLMLQAWEVAKGIGPLDRWKGTLARTWAGRLAANLGGMRLARVMHWLTWKRDRKNIRACVYQAAGVMERRGPLGGIHFLESVGEPDPAQDPDSVIYLYTLRARAYGYFRDFESADEWMAKARGINADSAWLATEEAFLCERKDQYDQALEAIDRSLELHPWYRPAVGSKAHFLRLKDRDEEAMALLKEAGEKLECGELVGQLASLQVELELFEEARANFDRYVEMSPLLTKDDIKGLNHSRVTVACHCDELKRAAELAREIDEPYYKKLVERLELPDPPKKRVRLDVPFIRQHHVTCAPATLSALGRFWEKPTEHLELAEAICYDGTPAQSERQWAEKFGWVAREFTVDWETSVALLDRGIPFTVTTSEATSGHLQAVVGYDELRATLLLRDPYVYNVSEAITDKFLERYAATGPRGMVMVPEARAELLEGVKLPDAELYDQFYRLQLALDGHRREEAAKALAAMTEEAAEHRLTLTAQRAMASYDANVTAMLQCLEGLLKQFPDNSNLNLTRLSCLREIGRREDRLKLLEELCEKKDADPVFFQQYAVELRPDGRERELTGYWLERALRYLPLDASVLTTSGGVLWEERRFEEAVRRYRLAACLEDKNEQHSSTYFQASRYLKQTEKALGFLRRRAEVLGGKSAQPVITLFECLGHLGRTTDAFDALEEGFKRRPEDGDLMLFIADAFARYGKYDKADEYLTRAKEKTSRAGWLRLAARLAGYRLDRTEALKLWREVLATDPLALDANREVAVLLAETEGQKATLEFLDEVCRRFPYHCALQSLRLEWMKEEPAERVVPALRELIAINPTDSWAYRELALVLGGAGKKDEAMEAAGQAIKLEPASPFGYSTRGELHTGRGEMDRAKEDYREAIRLDVDNGFAVTRLMACCSTLAERQKVLSFVEHELVRQTVFGDALFAFREAASGVLEPDGALALFRRALDARPDLWAAWTVVVLQLTDMGLHDEALEKAREANEKFPLLPSLWMARARVHQARLETEDQIKALQEALAINPAHSDAAQMLAAAYERGGDFERTREVLEEAVARNPLYGENHRVLAEILWRLEKKEEALERAQTAARLEPGDKTAWNMIHTWSIELNQPTLAVDLIRALTKERAGEARSWLLLADVLDEHADTEELFAALDKALELNPRAEDVYDRKALALARLNRFDEAMECCRPPVFQPPSSRLQVRGAWIDAHCGNMKRAIKTLERVLRETPNLPGAWSLLTEWYWETGEREKAVGSSEKMAELEPFNPVPLGYSGDLKRRTDDTAGAMKDFKRAFQLDPSYSFAGFSLFDLQVQELETDAAKATLEVLERHVGGDLVTARRGQLLAVRGDMGGAFEILAELCTRKTDNAAPVDMLIHKLDELSQVKRVDRTLKESLEHADVNPHLGAVWVYRVVGRDRWFVVRRLKRLVARGEVGRRAVIAYVELLGERCLQMKSRGDVTGRWKLSFLFGRVMAHNKEWLRKDDIGWGKVGYALTNIGPFKDVEEWLSDWKDREGVESWMLYNLVLAMQATGRGAEALEVIRHANAMPQPDIAVTQVFRVWGMLEEALAGNLEEASRYASDLDEGALEQFWKPVLCFARAVFQVKKSKGGDRKQLWADVKHKIRESLGGERVGRFDPLIKWPFKRAIRQIGTDLDSLRPQLWGWWCNRGAGTWILTGVVVFVIFRFLGEF